MPAECLLISDLETQIAVCSEAKIAAFLLSDIAATDSGLGVADFLSDIRADWPSKNFNAEIAVRFVEDTKGPVVIPQTYPLEGAGGIGVYGPVFVVVEDLNRGIDLASLEFIVNSVAYTQNSPEITFLEMIEVVPPFRYVIRYIPNTAWPLGSIVNVSIMIKDRAGNYGLAEATV